MISEILKTERNRGNAIKWTRKTTTRKLKYEII